MKKVTKWISWLYPSGKSSAASKVSTDEISAPEAATSLCDLPVLVLERISQLLVDDGPIRPLWSIPDFMHSLLPLMYLRASCVYLNDVVVNMILKLDCEITSDWIFSPHNANLSKLLDFMTNETNWRFRSLTIERSMNYENCSNVMIILSQHEILFRKSVKKLILPLSKDNQNQLIAMFEWLSKIALTSNCFVSITFDYLSLSITVPNPEIISELTFNDSLELRQNESNERAVQLISVYQNLTILNIPYLQYSVTRLKAFPHLKCLYVASLSLSHSEDVGSSLKFPNIESLSFCSPNENHFDQLPRITKHCFPCITHFGFYESNSAVKNKEINFSRLPITCKFLKTNIDYFVYFAECKSIQYVYLVFNYDRLDLFQSSLPLSFLNISLLSISFEGHWIYPPELLEFIIFLIENFRELEVLCLNHISMSYGQSHVTNVFRTIFDGDKYRISTNFFREQIEMRRLFRRNDNLKILRLGQTCWLKKTVCAALLKELDGISSAYNWNLRPRNGVFLPFELLTD